MSNKFNKIWFKELNPRISWETIWTNFQK